MNSLWKQLTPLLPAPKSPKGLDRSWRSVEKELGLPLPSDYKRFIDTYGTGLICGKGMDFGYLGVWNYRDRSEASPLSQSISSVIREYEDARSKGYDSPCLFYPDSGGLLPFANTASGDYFNWTTSRSPDQWDVVFYHFDRAEMVSLKGHSFIQVFVDLLTHKSSLMPDKIDPNCLAPPFRYTEVNW
jgi:hypothetical protein